MENLDPQQIEGIMIGLGFMALILVWAFIGMSKWEFTLHPPEAKEPEGGRICSVSYDDHMERTYGTNKSDK